MDLPGAFGHPVLAVYLRVAFQAGGLASGRRFRRRAMVRLPEMSEAGRVAN
jgi:hypothetical protein